jgi:SAM-dependent methyltransferase
VDAAAHWNSIYAERSTTGVSWYEPTPTVSLRHVRRAVEDGAQTLIDVGGGASTLVDEALHLGLSRIAVVDVSEQAISVAKTRLGPAARQVEWLVGDVSTLEDLGGFDIWHDRAVFHFLTDRITQERYVALCERTVLPDGVAVMATFAPDGPETCSGLPVQRYDADRLAERCGPRFRLIGSERHVHTTPRGVEQRFIYASFRRDEPV